MSDQPLVQMVKISKSFGTVQALKDVDFDVRRQEVMGLVGDNGAGKSTLIKILTGVYPPDSGEIYFEGKKVKVSSPKDARDLGIETVYQDLALIPLMSISRNFFLGREPVKQFGPVRLLDKRKMDETVKEVLAEIGIRVRSPDEEVAILSGGERQSVAIGRAVYFGAKLLILDEPTSALSIRETHKVLDYILEAKGRGLSIVFITHNIYHVYSVADRFTILEHGRKVAEFSKGEVSAEEIIEIIRSGHQVATDNNGGKS
ncbi:TPA: sugar ABC transporter ATP-binding protein [Candidatus Bipolaricaulota bacterium]|nr:sugar ABC transporter ATP-binding protein [Candidatus Bipolaricaulota bacterium]